MLPRSCVAFSRSIGLKSCMEYPELSQLAHSSGGVAHAIGKTPFIVIPAQNTHQLAADHLCLGQVKSR